MTRIGPGVQVGPYQVAEQLGRGGMATVWKAYHPALEKTVAIKVLPEMLAEDPDFRERFHREAVAIARLKHPNILTVYDHAEHEGQPYIVTEYVEGGTLESELGKPLTVPRTLQLLEPIAAALDYAHWQGVLHRDIKPSNILLSRDGTPVLGDFGLARMMAGGERLTRLEMVVGTPEYMAPEQCSGAEASPASDQYSLGVVAYEALTGRVPYSAETPAAVLMAQIQAPLPPPRQLNPDLPEAVERVLMRALSKEPSDRFPTSAAFMQALREAATSDSGVVAAATPPPMPAAPVPTSAPTAITPAPPSLPAEPMPSAPPVGAATVSPGSRLPLLIGAGVIVVLLLAGGVVFALTRGGGGGGGPAGIPQGTLVSKVDFSTEKTTWYPDDVPSPDPANSASIRYGGGAGLDFMVAQDTGFSGQFAGEAVQDYREVLVFSATAPDSDHDAELDWQVRAGTQTQNANTGLNIDAQEGSMTLVYSPDSGSNVNLTPTITVPGLSAGKTITLTIVAKGDQIQLYVGSNKVADVHEPRTTGATVPYFYFDGKQGSAWHFKSIEVYKL